MFLLLKKRIGVFSLSNSYRSSLDYENRNPYKKNREVGKKTSEYTNDQ